MKSWNWIIFAVAYASTLIVTAPSSLLGGVVSHFSRGRIELANSRGTLWHGSVNPVIHQSNGGMIALSTLEWNIALHTLLTGKLLIQVHWDDDFSSPPMDINLHPNEIKISHARIPLSATLLNEMSDFLKPAQLDGQVILQSESLLFNKQGIAGTATADWMNASSLLSNIVPLGNYHFSFISTPGGIDISLDTQSGVLILKGNGHFSPSGGLNFTGTAQAEHGKEDALKELLSHLGPEERPGVNTFSLFPTNAASSKSK